jgi:hypothetical protein
MGAVLTVTATLVLTWLYSRLPLETLPFIAGFSFMGLVALDDEERVATANRVREVLGILGIAQTTAAEQYMRWDRKSFERALAGEQKLDWWRLAMLGPEFRRLYALLELRDLGLPTLVKAWLKVEPALDQFKRVG